MKAKVPTPEHRSLFRGGRASPLDPVPPQPVGACGCGCGGQTTVPVETSRVANRVKDVPMRFVHGHHRRVTGPLAVERDAGYATPCWEWAHNTHRAGYGWWSAPAGAGKQTRYMAHRISFIEFGGGTVAPDEHVDHLCSNRLCVNPAHLEAVAPGENTSRMWRAGRAGTEAAVATRRAHTHCAKGHPFDEDNTAWGRDGRRRCRTCARATARAGYYRRKGADLNK